MSDRLSPAWRVVVSRRTRRGLIHAWGSASGARPAPRAAYLEAAGPARRRVFGTLAWRAATDPEEAEVGLSLTGDVTPDDAGTLEWTLVLEWRDGRAQRVPLQGPAAGASRVPPWRRYLRTAATLVARRDFRTLASEIERVLWPAASARRDPRAVLRWLRRDGGRLVLMLDHGLGGGAHVYGAGLCGALAAQGNAILRLVPDPWSLGYRLLAQRGNQSRAARLGDLAQLEEVLGEVRFAETWFNNLLSFADTPGVIAALARWQAAGQLGDVTFLVHDYFAACPSWTLIDHSGRHCGVPPPEVCARCLPENRAPFLSLARDLTIPRWRALWAPILRAAREVRCFSESSRALLLRAHPDLPPERVTVVPHAPAGPPLRRVAYRDEGAPVVGVVGVIAGHKGAEVLRDLSLHLRDCGSPMRLVVAGAIECELAPEVATLTGPYRRDELPDLLERHGVNVALVPSVWPETYSYVTDELMQMGLPLLVFDLGAPAERVRAYARGQVAPLGSPAELAAALSRLYQAHVAGAGRT